LPTGRPGLKSALLDLERAAPALGEESTLRQRFVEAIDGFLQGSLLSRKEVRAVLDERLVRGKPDARVGALLFEVKLPPPGPGIDAAIAQVRGQYLPEFQQRHQRPARGVAYDGLTLAFLESDGTVVRQGRPSAVAHVLESWLIALGSDIVTSDDFVARLGSASPLAHEMAEALWKLFQAQRHQNRFVEQVFQVWRGLYGVTTNFSDEAIRGLHRSAESMGIQVSPRRQDVEEFLFVVESYLALLLKLLVARAVVQQRLTDYPSLEMLLADGGSLVDGLGRLEERASQVRGVFEEDVFLWPVWASILDAQAEPQLEGVLRAVASNVDDIDLVGAPRDFLRVAYQRFIDPVSRRTLGEFYTSEELVRETLDAVGYDGDMERRLIDIACGSGTFLVEAIGRALEQNRDVAAADLLGRITTNIIGVDIHPFAVAMARVNYLIAVSPLLEASEPSTFTIPVFWADSLARLRPELAPTLQQRAPIPLTLPGLPKFKLPDPNDIEWGALFGRVGEAVQRVSEIQRGQLDSEAVWAYFWSRADQEDCLPYQATLREFVTTIVGMHNDNRDMRWVPLMRNILAVAQYEGACDYVVGNPPWVRIHNISPAIRERLFDSYVMFMGAGWRRGARLGRVGRGFSRLVDYSVAFVERGLEFLKPGGRLGFVITSQVMHTLYASALRRSLVRDNRVLQLGDYSLFAKPLFEDATNYPLVLAVEKAEPESSQATGISVTSPSGQSMRFSLAQGLFPLIRSESESPWCLAPPAARDAFEAMYRNCGQTLLGESERVHPMMGVMTQLDKVFVVRDVRVVPEEPTEVIAFAEGYYPNADSRYVARVERSVLRSLLRGRDVAAWRFQPSVHFLWTHDDSSGAPLPDLPPKARAYFESHADALRGRADYRDSMPIWQVFRVSAEKLGHAVVWQEISTCFEACYVSQTRDVSAPTLVVPLKTVFLLPVTSEKQGLVLAGWFNSLPVRALILTYSRRDRGAYRHFGGSATALLPMPEQIFRLAQDGVVAPPVEPVLAISGALHANPARSDRRALEEELDGRVARLYGLDDAALQAMREFYAFITPGTTRQVPGEDASGEEAD
jgi:hypothetical protein